MNRVLQQTFPYISPIKTAIVGAHFGGFLSIYTLANDPGASFGCAVAISPISSWQTLGNMVQAENLMYHLIHSTVYVPWHAYIAAPYAERYLGLLNDRDGQRHYFESDLSTSMKTLHLKDVLLVHGTLEEKYPVTHSMLFAKAMVKKRFPFQQQVQVKGRLHFLWYCITGLVMLQLFPDATYEDMMRNAQMYESIDKFLNACFDRRQMPELDTTLHKGD